MMQEEPFTLKVELTEGCNLYCDFCGLQGIREGPGGPYKFMSVATADKIGELMAKAEWNPRIEMAMHGEPTMNPNRVNIIAALRDHLPRASIMMTSNGGGLLPDPFDKIQAMMDAGLNILALDDYDYVNIVDKIEKEVICERYPENPDANPYRRRPKDSLVVIMPDISATAEGVHSANIISNHCGAAGPRNQRKQGKRCARPFRELAITWDGEVVLCCNDWRREFTVGNVNNVSDIRTLWDHPAMHSIRKYAYHGQRTIGPCDGCDSHSHRCGLLPDKKGQEHLDEPTLEDEQRINDVLGHGPLTLPVLREWEL